MITCIQRARKRSEQRDEQKEKLKEKVLKQGGGKRVAISRNPPVNASRWKVTPLDQ